MNDGKKPPPLVPLLTIYLTIRTCLRLPTVRGQEARRIHRATGWLFLPFVHHTRPTAQELLRFKGSGGRVVAARGLVPQHGHRVSDLPIASKHFVLSHNGAKTSAVSRTLDISRHALHTRMQWPKVKKDDGTIFFRSPLSQLSWLAQEVQDEIKGTSLARLY